MVTGLPGAMSTGRARGAEGGGVPERVCPAGNVQTVNSAAPESKNDRRVFWYYIVRVGRRQSQTPQRFVRRAPWEAAVGCHRQLSDRRRDRGVCVTGPFRTRAFVNLSAEKASIPTRRRSRQPPARAIAATGPRHTPDREVTDRVVVSVVSASPRCAELEY